MSPASTTRSACACGIMSGSSFSRCRSDSTRTFTGVFTVRAPYVLALLAQHFPRIHQVQRIERGLDRAHQREFDLALVVHVLVDLQLPESVFGADRAAMALHAVVDDAVQRFLVFREEALRVAAF